MVNNQRRKYNAPPAKASGISALIFKGILTSLAASVFFNNSTLIVLSVLSLF